MSARVITVWHVICPITGDMLRTFDTERDATVWARRHGSGVVWSETERRY